MYGRSRGWIRYEYQALTGNATVQNGLYTSEFVVCEIQIEKGRSDLYWFLSTSIGLLYNLIVVVSRYRYMLTKLWDIMGDKGI